MNYRPDPELDPDDYERLEKERHNAWLDSIIEEDYGVPGPFEYFVQGPTWSWEPTSEVSWRVRGWFGWRVRGWFG